ncbi:thermonuclease family protein [Parasphingopyxis sp.]|uniref:thermonuclease family protein n=1 Tax=Parasphingopyxis sp. TaxID=1920299 RepID=UPI00263703FC|nr:thermonuclease family protein [Parasphingopyxis sp.]
MARPRPRNDITLPYLLMIALIVAIVGKWALEFAERRVAPADTAAQPFTTAPSASPSFAICGSGPRVNCVVDGDTFWMRGEKIRILDIDTPELSPPRCAEEERLGEAAKARLHALLNSGAVTLERAGRDRDRYDRLLRRVHVDGQPVGDMLIAEGLARPYGGGRRSWCG